jgi:hypothetical protein
VQVQWLQRSILDQSHINVHRLHRSNEHRRIDRLNPATTPPPKPIEDITSEIATKETEKREPGKQHSTPEKKWHFPLKGSRARRKPSLGLIDSFSVAARTAAERYPAVAGASRLLTDISARTPDE